MEESQVKKELALGSGASIIKLVHLIIEEGGSLRASDIHIDPQADFLMVRFRIDGVMQEAYQISKNIHSEIISRIKILSGLRTDEHQAAQDGRFRHILANGRPVDVRVSIAPTYYGENTVLRLLADTAMEFSLENLDFSKDNCDKIQSALRRPYGMILATGPTGSGKTTTLYTLIKKLNTKEVSMVTIEDPVEYAIAGVTQIQANAKSGLTFANGLRSILRQDPNVIMIGEIRDGETAGIAVNIALTGHIILSTLHTNDAATTLPRLIDMGIEPYLISSTVNLVIGQRLLRRICLNCRAENVINETEYKSLGKNLNLPKNKIKFFKGQGCEKCNFSGYLGRVGVQEVLVPNQKIREVILEKKSASEIRSLAIKQGMTTIIQDGLNKAALGITTLAEVLKMFYE